MYNSVFISAKYTKSKGIERRNAIFLKKLYQATVRRVINWIADFLIGRLQRVELNGSYFSGLWLDVRLAYLKGQNYGLAFLDNNK